MGVVKGLKNLKDPASFRAWAYRIVTLKSADWIRRQQRDRNLHEESIEANAAQAPSPLASSNWPRP